MKKVDIYGSCFTRELFNYTNDYKVLTYLLQQSIFTLDSVSYKIGLEEIKTHDNFAFKNRMVYYDFNKIAFSKLSENPAEYLIIDLADQVRDVLILNDHPNVKLTSSTAIKENLDRLGEEYHPLCINDLTDEEIVYYIKKFIDLILSLYDRNKILINIVQMQSEYYINGEKKLVDENIPIYKKKPQLKRIEELFLASFPDCKTLYTKEAPILDINHRLGGPHPMHFEGLYYDYRMRLLDAMLNENDNNIPEIESNYKKAYEQSIGEIRKKVLKR